jgi:DNA helicase HerA-like ATPase
MEEKNLIIGSVLGQASKSEEILVVTSLDKSGKLKKATILAHDTSYETILLQVVDKITLSDVSEQDLFLMSENERLAFKILEKSPVTYVLKTLIVGSIRLEENQKNIFGSPNSFVADKSRDVRKLSKEEKKMIYDRGSLEVGITFDDSKVTLPVNGLLQRHLSIIGMTGCGKSFLIGLLCEELAKHNAAILLLDPHNEYLPMAQSLPKKTKRMLYGLGTAVGLNKFTLDVKNISAYDFKHFTGMGDGSTSILDQVIREMKKRNQRYSMDDIIAQLNNKVNNSSKSEATAASWARNYLQNLASTGFFGTSEPKIGEMIQANQVSVIAMSGIKEKIQQFIITNLLQRIFDARRKEEIPPVVLIVEEAHRFAPSGQNVSSSDILRTLATEGRKFGICLFVASQRPNRLDSTVLSQCVTNIVMKIKNPADLASVRESAENATEDVINQLPKFERGEALVMGESFPVSIRFMVKSERKTKHGGKSVDYKSIWKEETKRTDSETYEFPDEL